MKILFGLYNGMVMQREGDLCRIRFAAEAEGDVTVDGFHARLTEAEPMEGHRSFWLTGIPVGGPYTVTLTDATDSVTLTDLYVGDVWLLGGQSNMEGIGYYRDIAGDLHQQPALRQFSFDNTRWELAEPRLHRGWLSPEPFLQNHFAGHGGVHDRGVGPGFYFAEDMYRRTGVPQGLIPCALGGSPLNQWAPEPGNEEPPLYQIAIRRFRLCGSNLRGIFWYQGCSDTNPDAIAVFTERMERMVAAFRKDTGIPTLPFVQVQIGRFTMATPADDAKWSNIREQQRRLGDRIPYLDTVAVTDADYADGIHLQARYHKRLGKNAAESMYRLCFDLQGLKTLPAPVLDSVRIIHGSDDFGENLAISFQNVHGDLQSVGVPSGFAISHSPDKIDTYNIFRLELVGNTVYIRHEAKDDELKEMYLSYYFGNGSYANITDNLGRPLPAFGPLKIGDLLAE